MSKKSKANFSSVVHIGSGDLWSAAYDSRKMAALIDGHLDRVRNEFVHFCYKYGYAVDETPQPIARHCASRKGNPKQSFPSADVAMAFAAQMGTQDYVKAYPCEEHGWHLGGRLTRGLRSAMRAPAPT